MFSIDIKQKAVAEYLAGGELTKIMATYGIRGSATLYQWVGLAEEFGAVGLDSHNHIKTSVPSSLKMRVITWRLKHHASLPVAARHFGIRHPS